MEGLNKIDWIALSFWLACWVFYGFWSSKSSLTQPSLMGTVAHHRRTWMREAYQRENRITDSALVNNLMQSATFFSSTTILILGALVAVLGSLEHNSEIVGVVRSFPLARQVSAKLLEFKTLVLSLVFVYAFLRFTMSLRQFNLINILIGAFPAAKTHQIPGDKLIDQAARLNELAGNNFTQGLRAYYFAFPLVMWLINTWLLVAAAVMITLTTYYMEFHSATVQALRQTDTPVKPSNHPHS